MIGFEKEAISSRVVSYLMRPQLLYVWTGRDPTLYSLSLKDSSALLAKSSNILTMAERVEMCRRTVVVDGKVYSVRRQSGAVFLLRLNDLVVRYVVVTADSIDFHGFERFVWPEAADRVSSFEKLDHAAAYYLKLTGSSKE